ncbi:MAG TPA: hypothetical protein VFP46_00605 [Candidatus Paceibacterota bacterium]|nr:hypothetical protein [Candidatus Paceibacterota bacterium]
MNRTRGFTLLETGIVLGITVFAMAALTNLYVTFTRVYGYEQVYTGMAGSANESMAAIEAAVLPADGVLVSHAFSTGTFTTGTSTLVLELPSIDASGVTLFGLKDYIAIYATSTYLMRRVEANVQSVRVTGTKQLAGSLASLSLTYDNADVTLAKSITASLRMNAQYNGQTASSTLSQVLYLRNTP